MTRPEDSSAARALVWAALGEPGAHILLIEGPSGAGKSTFAGELRQHWPGPDTPRLVRMDGLYPGWSGLEAAARALVRDLLLPLSRGERGFWTGYDWEAGRTTKQYPVDPGLPLIVEGCGALSRASARLADLRIWIGAEDGLRKRRALARDGDTYLPHWDAWQRDYEIFTAREDPRALADLRLRATETFVIPEGHSAAE